MKKHKSILIVTGLLIPFVLGAQFTDFDLSKYKLPDIRLNRLDATFNFLNDLNTYLYHQPWDTTKTKSNRLSGSLNLGYYYFRNSEKYQGNLIVNTYLRPEIYKYGTENTDKKTNNTEGSFIISSTNRFYNQRMFFVEIDPDFFFNSEKNRILNENGTTTESINRESYTGLSVPLSVGYGRIEPVEDMRLAVYILEELQKAGRIPVVPPEDVIIKMAREISRIKKKRFFDIRIRKMEELHVIDSFLVANDIISSNDITYFTVLNDNWDYASGPARESGFAVNAGIGNNIQINRISDKYTVNNTVMTDNKYFQD